MTVIVFYYYGCNGTDCHTRAVMCHRCVAAGNVPA